MDFKFKGIGWVGGIFQKFETLCHEMDNIVNQDTVKYVENQAQCVGKSMKRFYSDVVLPRKHEGQGVALNRSTTFDTSLESLASIQDDHISTVCNLSHVEPVAFDAIEKQLDHASNELCPSVLLSIPTSVDALDGAESGIIFQQSDFTKTTSSVVSIQENSINEKASGSDVPDLISPREEESFGESFANKFIDCTEKISSGVVDEVSLTMLVHDMEIQSPKKENRISHNITVDVVNRQLERAFGELCRIDPPVNPNSLDSHLEKQYVTSEEAAKVLNDTKPEVNLEEYSTMEKPSVSKLLGLVTPFEKESRGASLLSTFSDSNDKEMSFEAEVSPATSVQDVRKPSASDVSELISLGEEESFGASLVNEIVDCDDKNLSMVHTDVSSATSAQGDQNAREIKDECAYRTVNSSKSLTGISGNKNLHVGGESAQLQVSSSSNIGPVDDSIDDINISSMETIELYDEVKLEDSFVIPDSTALYAGTRIMNKHKSYKKRIQDALTSRKRLTKEYEQLAIWFGDADMGSVHDNFQTLRPSSSTATSDPKNTQTEIVCDSDWELL
ncbi:hypothetical protein HRI_005054500 [Hibiscus trionum]|uniref:Uncharacterized protein n=1 Tax=Hibiscus trionum TaxID=183268 RepID=A0A9W7MQC2_HIBTR|nr:hypothetical protein HRI_005054500 [Hibiscus trionum]